MMDPSVMERLSGIPGGGPAPDERPSAIGPCFQLALMAASQGNDQEAGEYLRQIIVAMKAMAGPRKADG